MTLKELEAGKTAIVTAVGGEGAAGVEGTQLHPVVVDHAIRGNFTFSVLQKVLCPFLEVGGFQLLHTDTAAIQRHDMVFPDFLQVPEVLYHCDLLTAEGQVDEVLDGRDALRCRCCLELEGLTHIETIQPLG